MANTRRKKKEKKERAEKQEKRPKFGYLVGSLRGLLNRDSGLLAHSLDDGDDWLKGQ